MHIITLDIEEWYIEKTCLGGRRKQYELFGRTLDKCLQLLSDNGVAATFFCLGQMGRHFPEVIRKIKDAGHEIGCHSNIHRWLNKMTVEECREDTKVAVETLEQCIGQKIKSYRAPAFSITAQNPWAFEILSENGIERDASVFPAARDFGGFSEFGAVGPSIVSRNGVSIKEFPVCPLKVLGRQIVYSGGGYFRFFPESFIRYEINRADYVMMYFHINDLASIKEKFLTQKEFEWYYKEPGTFFKRCKRYFKGNFAWGNTFEKFSSIVRKGRFTNLEQAEKEIEWDELKRVEL